VSHSLTGRLRAWLGPVALCLALSQAAATLVSGLCCCREGTTQVSSDDCCPEGSHPPGMCPLKHGAQAGAASRRDTCRLSCAASLLPRFVLTAGVLPLAKPASAQLMALEVVAAIPPRSLIEIDLVPHAPPPKV
jgi:hypothetical protein